MADAPGSPGPGFWQLALGDGTPRQAAITAAVVGTVLVAINQGDLILAGGAPPPWKLALTYLVPYCVATWGAVTAKRAHLRAAARSAASKGGA